MPRILTAVLVALAISGCRSADSYTRRDDILTGPVVNPGRPTVAGTWGGTASGSIISLTMSHDTPTGAITGTGNISDGERNAPLTILGTYSSSNVSLTISSNGYQPMNLTGVHANGIITGSVNGSGFNNAAITLTKR